MYTKVHIKCSYKKSTFICQKLTFKTFCGYNARMRGRPKKAESEARQNVLRIRLTEEERQLLDEAAKGKSLETSTWGRMELIALARKLLKEK